MDFEVMKKKLDAYRKPSGQFRSVKPELLVELLRIWENHTGASIELAKKLGMTGRQLGRLIQQARKIATTSDVIDPAFHALQIPSQVEALPSASIEMSWGGDKVIRFPTVDALVDFLKRAA